jgi:HTH-type transcriptional regulator / antitoxin HipB
VKCPERDDFWHSASFLVAFIPIGKISSHVDITSPAELGATLREARRRRGLRLEDVAAGASVGVRFLSELERGKPTARLGETLRVLSSLGLRLSSEDPDG